MADIIITESGDTIVSETVAGIADASTLNDINVATINKEEFLTNPTDRGWLVGSGWEWDSVNKRMQII